MKIGFSTGSLDHKDVRRGLRMATHERAKAIELSALREDELDPLIAMLDLLSDDLRSFEHISFHAPSKLRRLSEREFVDKLKPVADRGWAIIVHPDVINDVSLWRKLGHAVCIENMDKRKHIGRTVAQLRPLFKKLPEATFCFDIGHARQVDPTMQEAKSFLSEFRSRLRQVHMSYVNTQSKHERLNRASTIAFQRVAHQIDASIPVILETPIKEDEIEQEIDLAEGVFLGIDQRELENLKTNSKRNGKSNGARSRERGLR